MGGRQTDARTVWKELAWRVDLVGIGRGVTVRVYGGKREKEIETEERRG